MFESIVAIQSERRVRVDAVTAAAALREQNQISKKKFRAFYDDWISHENRLAGEANELYIVATRDGCFKQLDGGN